MTLASPDTDKAADAGAVPEISTADRIGAPVVEETVAIPAPPVSIVPLAAATSSQMVMTATPVVPPPPPALTPSAPPPPPAAPPIPPIGPEAAAAMPLPPPPPAPAAPPPFGKADTSVVPPGGRKPLVGARTPKAEAPKPMPSEIQPNEQGRRRSRNRSRAARSSVVVMFDGLISLCAVAAVLLGIAAMAGRQEFELPGPLAATTSVLIPPKKSRDEIGDILEKAGVVSDRTVFVYGSVLAQFSDLKAGEYEFKPHATMREVAEAMQQGHFVRHKITFPEGWTSEQIVQKLLDDPILTGKITSIPEEGSLEPNTYLFTRGDSREGILAQMRREQERHLTEIWAHRNADALKQLKVPKDLLILASIIEKETGRSDERARVAAVFVNRLNKGMRLETDPTILYGLYGGKAWMESRTITKAELAAPNPYNTYKINGLPPGPIGNPGRAALEAAANPAITNDLFFVADGTGGHAFAETFEEHKKNVDRWREIERQRKAADPNAPATPGPGTGVQNTPANVVAPVTPGTKPVTPATPVKPKKPKPGTPDPTLTAPN